MAPSNILAPTIIDYTSHVHSSFGDLVRSTSKEHSSANGFASKLSDVGGVVSSTTETFVRRVDPYNEEESPTINQEYKLPSRRSMFIIIGGNALFQVRSGFMFHAKPDTERLLVA
jgi:hypothetical protein